MKVLLYGINYAPELIGIGKYSSEMAEWLAAHGQEVRVVTAPPYYPEWKVKDGYSAWSYQKERRNGVEIFRAPLFVPEKPSTATRLIHLISFSFTSLWSLLRQLSWRPDVIIVVEPSFFCTPATLLAGAITGAKTILHVQDYELDAMFGLGMMHKGFLAKLAFGFERWIMRRFDRVSTISSSMVNLAMYKGVKEQNIILFPNWVDTDYISPHACGDLYHDRWGVGDGQKIVLYSGNLGNKQGLEIVLEAAQVFSSNSKVQFFIVGQGAKRSELARQATLKKLDNLHFKDLVPYEDLPELMSMADIHLVVQKKGAADVVLPSKLTSILSAGGHALITAEKETELGLLVEKYPGIAKLVEPENLDEFVQGLECLLGRDTKATNNVARNYAVNLLSRDILILDFFLEIEDLCGLYYPDD